METREWVKTIDITNKTMNSGRIGGDYSAEALEAFRSAYAAQMMTPEDLDTHKDSGLPASEISNTSPWYSSVGLWKYPSGKGPESDLREPFNPDVFLKDKEDGEDGDVADVDDADIDAYLDSLSSEELAALALQLGVEDEPDYEPYEDEEVNDEVTDEEIDALIDELLNSEEG